MRGLRDFVMSTSLAACGVENGAKHSAAKTFRVDNTSLLANAPPNHIITQHQRCLTLIRYGLQSIRIAYC